MNLKEIPFSFPDSYFAFNYYDDQYMNQPDIGNFPVPKPEIGKLTLRTVHYSVKTSFI